MRSEIRFFSTAHLTPVHIDKLRLDCLPTRFPDSERYSGHLRYDVARAPSSVGMRVYSELVRLYSVPDVDTVPHMRRINDNNPAVALSAASSSASERADGRKKRARASFTPVRIGGAANAWRRAVTAKAATASSRSESSKLYSESIFSPGSLPSQKLK